MRVIDVIENYCGCKICRITADLRGGRKILYTGPDKPEFAVTVNPENIPVNITYSGKTEMTPDSVKFVTEMAGCLLESQEHLNLHEELSRVAQNTVGSTDLDALLQQTLNTIICSHLFDKAALMFYNPLKEEMRAVHIAGIPPYTEEQAAYFKTVRVRVTKETLDTFVNDVGVPTGVIDSVFEQMENAQLKNTLIISPLFTGQRVYGILVTYSEAPYDEKHIHASRSTARFITAILSASIVYKQYGLSLASEERLTNQIKQNEHLLALGNYAATIAHEIKNPLISIGGFAKRLMHAINDPSLRKMANIISTESERLERLTEDILSFSKKHEPHKTPVLLTEEIQNIKALFDFRSKETNVEIRLQIADNIIVNVDRNQFRQVVVNLVANAMNAVGSDGTVTISCYDRNRNYDIIIADTGKGVPEENLPRLFKPFFTTSPKGTGLGLAISKKIMINHGGDITVRNGIEGAEFTLTIPKQN